MQTNKCLEGKYLISTFTMCTDDCFGLDGESETWANEETMQCVKCS